MSSSGESSLRRTSMRVMSAAFWPSVRVPLKGLPWKACPLVEELKAFT